MDDIMQKTRELVEAITSSDEYVQYQRLQKKLESDRALFDRVNEYRRRSFLLHNRSEHENTIQQVRALREEYKKELSSQDVMEYLIAEQTICNRIRDISQAIADGVVIDYHFLENE